MAIGEAAARFGLATHVLRHWETIGLLTPARLANGRRRYRPQDLTRVAVIVRGKQAGLGLEEIGALLTNSGPPQRRAILSGHRDALRQRIDALQACLHLVEGALDCRAQNMLTCPDFKRLLAATGDLTPVTA